MRAPVRQRLRFKSISQPIFPPFINTLFSMINDACGKQSGPIAKQLNMFPPGNREKYSMERENIFPNCAEVKENPLIFPLEHVVSGRRSPGTAGTGRVWTKALITDERGGKSKG